MAAVDLPQTFSAACDTGRSGPGDKTPPTAGKQMLTISLAEEAVPAKKPEPEGLNRDTPVAGLHQSDTQVKGVEPDANGMGFSSFYIEVKGKPSSQSRLIKKIERLNKELSETENARKVRSPSTCPTDSQ